MTLSTRTLTVVSWMLQLVVAGILFQTLFFKFSGAEESVYIFTTLGAEPWGRIASGVVELIAVLLLLHPRTAVYGALVSAGVITGALLSHVKLGIVVRDDGGLLFGLALIVLVSSLAIVFIRRGELPVMVSRATAGAGARRL